MGGHDPFAKFPARGLRRWWGPFDEVDRLYIEMLLTIGLTVTVLGILAAIHENREEKRHRERLEETISREEVPKRDRLEAAEKLAFFDFYKNKEECSACVERPEVKCTELQAKGETRKKYECFISCKKRIPQTYGEVNKVRRVMLHGRQKRH